MTAQTSGRKCAYISSLNSPILMAGASLATFTAHVCRNRARRLVDLATSLKRDRGTTPRSLSNPVNLGDDSSGAVDLSSTLSEDAYAMRTGRRSRSAAELLILRLDVCRIMMSLPTELAAVAALLAEGETPTAVARSLGMSRATINRRILRLRHAFRVASPDKQAGMRKAA